MKHLYLRLFILLLPFLVFYWQAPFLADKTIGNDYVAFPIQQQMELQFSLEHGTFPLYVPGFAGGHSSAALTLGQMYHPISHLASIMPGYWDGYAAWLFKEDRKHLYLYPALIAAPLFLFFNFVWVNHLTKTRAYIPKQFNKYPNWVEPAIIWIGFLSLVMVILYALWQLKGNRVRTRHIAGYPLCPVCSS